MRQNTKRKALFLATSATLIAGFYQQSAHASGSTYTWNSSTDQTWTTPANWSGSVVPGSGDVALFGTAVVPPSQTVKIGTSQQLGALIDNLAQSQSFTMSGPNSAPITLTVTGVTATVPQVGGTATFSNLILSATGTTSAKSKDMTLDAGVNLQLANGLNVIAGAQGGSAKSAFGNNITINGNISDASGGQSTLVYYGNGNSGFGGGQVTLAGTNSFSGGIVIGTPDGLNGGVVNVSSNSNLGSGSITVNSQSQIAFTANGTYGNPGQVLFANGTGLANNNISSGAFRTGAASIIWNGDLNIGTTSTTEGTNGFVVLSSTGSNIIDIHGKLTGTGSLQKQGGGTLIFSGTSNDCTGATQIGNGILTIAPGSSMSTGDLLMLQSSSNTGVALDLYNAHQNVGNLSSGFTQTSGSIFQFINIGSNSIGGTLNIKQTVNKSYGFGAGAGLTSTITGPGGISLDAGSTAALTLTGPNDFQGGTVINGGTLNLANGINGSAVGNGDVQVKSNGHLATGNATVLSSPVTDGTIGGNLVVSSGGVIAPGNDGQTGTLNVGGNLTLNDGAVFNIDVLGSGQNLVSDHVIASGTVGFASGNATVNILDGSTATGQSTIISYAAGSASFAGAFTLGTPSQVGGRHYSLTTGATGVVLTITDNSTVRYWSVGGGSLASSTPPGPVDGAGNGIWASGNGDNFFNSNADTPNAPYDNNSPANVVFGNGGSGGQINLGSDIKVGSVGGVGGTLVFGPNTSPYIIGVQNDPHMLTLVGGISATGNATINAPIILAQSQAFAPQVGAVLTINGGVSEANTSTVLTKAGLGTVVLNGTSTYTGGTVISAGVLQGPTWAIPQVASGVSVTDNGGLAFSQPGDGTFTYAGRITGTGSVGVNSSTDTAVVTLSASNAYTGATVFQKGVLAVSATNNLGTGTGGWRLTGGTLRILNDLSFPNTNAAASLVNGTTSTFDTNGHTLTLNQILNGGGNLVKTGGGTLTIVGIHTTDNIGTVGINAGTISIAPASSVSYGFFVDPGGNTFKGDLVLANPFELRLQGGLISGGGTVRVKPSTFQITSRGNVTIANTIVLNDNATPITGYTANFGANTLNTLTLGGDIQGRANIDITNGAGTTLLAHSYSYTAPPGATVPLTTIDNGSGGAVQLMMDNPLPTNTGVHVTGSGVFDLNSFSQKVSSIDASSASGEILSSGIGSLSTLTIEGSANTTYAGFLFDGLGTVALNLDSANTGTLTLSGTNTYSGGTTLSGGTLVISKNSNLGADTGSLTFNAGALAVNSAGIVRPLAINAGGGTIDVAATKLFSISGAGTTIWGGTLNIADSGTVSFSRVGATVSVTPGATLSIGSLSNVTVDATQDPFTDSGDNTRHVAIVNNGSFSVALNTATFTGGATIARLTGTGSLAISGGAKLALAPVGLGNSAGAISIDATSQLDLANNALAVNYTGATPDLAIRALLVSGRAAETWSGPGIDSSAVVAQHTALGYAEASSVGITSTFFGQPVDSTSVLIRVTYLGDANLDGKVNVLDFNALASNFGQNGTNNEWVQGDFNYDGKVDTSDFTSLAQNFNLSLAAPGTIPSAPLLGALVPEPMSLGMLAMVPMIVRRRRRG